MAPIGRVSGARHERAEARRASVLLVSLWGAAGFTEAQALDLGPRMALRASQRLEPSMASSPKRSGQRLGVEPSKGGRCAAN